MTGRGSREATPLHVEAHQAALQRAGDVFMWAATNGTHPDATAEGAAEQIVSMYLRELRDRLDAGCPEAILHFFPEQRR